MIIVHNLAQYHVANYLKNYLYHSATFKLIEKEIWGIENINDRHYLVEIPEKPEDKNLEVFHYIMAKEGQKLEIIIMISL